MNREGPCEEDSAESVDELPSDTVYSLLSHSKRGALLACLQRSDEPIALADLAREVAWRNSNCSMSEITSEEITATYCSLYHQHVPKLAKQGAVTLEMEDDTVCLTAKGEQLVAVQEAIVGR